VKVILRSIAERDITEAALWYEEQRPGLGETFLSGVDEALLRIGENPEGYPVVLPPQIRRILLSDFPYALRRVTDNFC
jgi:plasmid stabilization system protein ParE